MLRGDRLKELRKERHLSADEAAEFLQLTRSQLVNYENGKSDPSTAIFTRLVKFYGVSSDYLLGLSDMPKRKIVSWTIDLPGMVKSIGPALAGRFIRMSGAPVVPVRVNVPELVEQFGFDTVSEFVRELDPEINMQISAPPPPPPEE